MLIRLHKHARTTPAVRKYIKESKKNSRELSKELGVSVKTVLKWKNREDIYDKKATRRNLGIRISEMEEKIICLMRDNQKWRLSIDNILYMMQHCIRKEISYTSVYSCLKRNGLNDYKRKKLFIGEFREEDNIKGFIHMDVKYIATGNSREGRDKYYYLYVGIDRATRYSFISLKRELSKEQGREFINEFQANFPHKIKVILTDNGGEWTDRFANNKIGKEPNKPSGNHPFDLLCNELLIEHRLIKPKNPQTNGMVERLNRRIKEWNCYRPRNIKSFTEIKNYLQNLINNYNHTRFKAINYKSPYQLI